MFHEEDLRHLQSFIYHYHRSRARLAYRRILQPGFSRIMSRIGARTSDAGAYAEHLPIVCITGAPPLADIERNSLMHHTAGDGNFDNMMICALQSTVAQVRIAPQSETRAKVLLSSPTDCFEFAPFLPCLRFLGILFRFKARLWA